jgi:hypothetical protein
MRLFAFLSLLFVLFIGIGLAKDIVKPGPTKSLEPAPTEFKQELMARIKTSVSTPYESYTGLPPGVPPRTCVQYCLASAAAKVGCDNL